MTFGRFFKTKKKTIRKLEKIWKILYVFGQIAKSILALKKLGKQFFVEQFFFHQFVNNFLELLICQTNVILPPSKWCFFFIFLSYYEVFKILSGPLFFLGTLCLKSAYLLSEAFDAKGCNFTNKIFLSTRLLHSIFKYLKYIFNKQNWFSRNST